MRMCKVVAKHFCCQQQLCFHCSDHISCKIIKKKSSFCNFLKLYFNNCCHRIWKRGCWSIFFWKSSQATIIHWLCPPFSCTVCFPGRGERHCCRFLHCHRLSAVFFQCDRQTGRSGEGLGCVQAKLTLVLQVLWILVCYCSCFLTGCPASLFLKKKQKHSPFMFITMSLTKSQAKHLHTATNSILLTVWLDFATVVGCCN